MTPLPDKITNDPKFEAIHNPRERAAKLARNAQKEFRMYTRLFIVSTAMAAVFGGLILYGLEVDAPKIKVGQYARVTLDAMPGEVFEGKVRRIAPYVTEIEKQARTVEIEVDFEQPAKQHLLVGYSADVEAIIERRDDTLRIPTQAIRQDNKVFVLDADNKLEERQLDTGISNWSFTEVISGLNEGDQVLLSFDQDEIEVGVHVIQKTDQP